MAAARSAQPSRGRPLWRLDRVLGSAITNATREISGG
jgi:hypothetical protein